MALNGLYCADVPLSNYLLTHSRYTFSTLLLLVGHPKVLPQQCFWLTITTWWRHAVSKSGTLFLSQERYFLEARWQDSPHSHHNVSAVSWQHGGNMLSLVRNTVILQCFGAVGWVTGGAFGL